MEEKRIDIQVQADEVTLQGKYATMAQVVHTPEEFWIDFFALLPNTQLARLLARIIVSPAHAKRLGRAILDNVSRYESKYGQIDESKSTPPQIGFQN